jgi:DNA-binding LacI/PurR family transcriptional regulator
MNRLPQRVSLVSQTAGILRDELLSGAWARWLPGEHDLCSKLQVSRVTLRAALAQLEREGLLKGGQGRRREAVVSARRVPSDSASKVVALLSPVPLEAMQRFALYWIDDLREHLGAAGYRLELPLTSLGKTARPERGLAALALRLRPAGWVLYQSAAPVQEWFARRGLPCVVAGSCHPAVQLPAVDLDYRAACRHAAALFLARGHRCLAFLNPDPGLAGDQESAAGFREALRGAESADSETLIAGHTGTIPSLCQRVDALLRRPRRPTAWLVSKPHHFLTVTGCLARRGVRVPDEVALISRDHDGFLEHMLPSVARYVANPDAMARRISRIVLELVAGGAVKPVCHRLMPGFVDGETLGPAPPLTDDRGCCFGAQESKCIRAS